MIIHKKNNNKKTKQKKKKKKTKKKKKNDKRLIGIEDKLNCINNISLLGLQFIMRNCGIKSFGIDKFNTVYRAE